MTDTEAYRAIGERAEQLTQIPEVQKKMIEILNNDGKEAAEKWLYMSAIASLIQ